MLVSNKTKLATDSSSRCQKYNHWDYKFLEVFLEFSQYLLTLFWGCVIRCHLPNIPCFTYFLVPSRLDKAMWLIVEHFAADLWLSRALFPAGVAAGKVWGDGWSISLGIWVYGEQSSEMTCDGHVAWVGNTACCLDFLLPQQNSACPIWHRCFNEGKWLTKDISSKGNAAWCFLLIVHLFVCGCFFHSERSKDNYVLT